MRFKIINSLNPIQTGDSYWIFSFSFENNFKGSIEFEDFDMSVKEGAEELVRMLNNKYGDYITFKEIEDALDATCEKENKK